jgi:PAS domain S-box-containing protein
MAINPHINKYLDIIGSTVILINKDQTIGYINAAGCKLLNCTEDEILGKNWFDSFIPTSKREGLRDIFMMCLEGSIDLVESFANRIVTCKGDEKILLWHNAILKNDKDEIVGILSSGDDITETRRLQEALSESENKLREAQSIAKIGRWELDIATNNLAWSESIYRIFEVDQNTFNTNYESFLRFIHPDDRNKVDDAYKKSLENKIPCEILHRTLMEDGRVKWINEIFQTEYNELCKPVRSIGIVQDLTAQFQINEAYQKLSELNTVLLDSLSDQIALLDDQGKIISTNKAWKQYSQEKSVIPGKLTRSVDVGVNYIESCKSNFSDLTKEEQEICIGIQSVLEGRLDRFNYEYSSNYKAEHHWFNVMVKPLGSKTGGVVVIHNDITERKRIELHRIAEVVSHRDIIVREIHHRIKNNLQGVAGVLNNFSAKHPQFSAPIAEAISKVNSIAVIYGLLGRVAQTKVRLCELVSAIAKDNESLWETSISVDIPMFWTPCRILETEAVPLALILNELILNAIKHSDETKSIEITLRSVNNTEVIRLTVSNSGCLPSNFSFSGNLFTGTGLELVASLLPKQGISLFWEQCNGNVIAILELVPPIIALEQQDQKIA